MAGILDDLRRIVQVLRESSRTTELKLGVNGAQLFVLKALAGSRAISLNELAARTYTHQSTVSVVVKRLVDRGLVSRATSPLDARRVELALTRSGRTLLARAPRATQDRLIEGLEKLPGRERQALATALHHWVEALQLDDQEPPAMFFEEEGGDRHGSS